MAKSYWSTVNPYPNWFKFVNQRTMRADFFAGLTGSIIVLPQGLAFALIAGLPPVYGLYTAIIVPIIAGLFGSSLHMISGPTTAISLAVFAGISPVAEPGTPAFVGFALLLTFMVGVIQLSFGLARMGIFVNFVSHTVVVGFTTGAAFLIANSQLKNLSGLDIPNGLTVPETWQVFFHKIRGFNFAVFAVAATSFVVATLFKSWNRKLPYLIFGMLAGSILAQFLGGTAAGIKFVGAIPRGLPPFSWPSFDQAKMSELFPSAFAVAMIGLIEAIAIGKGIGTHTGQRIDSNREFVGQGLANLIGSFFSCYAGSGSFTRSGVNHQAGARTPLSAVFASLLLLLIMLFISPLAAFLPIPAMGGIIILVAINLIDLPEIKRIARSSRLEMTVFTSTFAATLLFDLEYAIFLGIMISLTFFLYKVSTPHIATMAPDPKKPDNSLTFIRRKPELRECSQIKIIRLDGPIFYGAVDHISDFFDAVREGKHQYCLILCEGVNFIGLAGAQWLYEEAKRWQARGGGLYLSNLKVIAQDVLIASGYKALIGENHFFLAKKDAIAHIYSLIPDEVCRHCERRVFRECRVKAEEGIENQTHIQA
jgi:SulP family sulfate permease